MDRNLYAPPEAEIVDLEALEGARPKAITWAIWLIWLWSALYVATLLIKHLLGMDPNRSTTLLGYTMALRIILTALVTYRLSRGGNWTRILMAIFFAISLTSLPTDWENHWQWIDGARHGAVPWSIAAYLACQRAVSHVIHLTWTILLFTPQANSWFDTMSYYAGTGIDPTKFGKTR